MRFTTASLTSHSFLLTVATSQLQPVPPTAAATAASSARSFVADGSPPNKDGELQINSTCRRSSATTATCACKSWPTPIDSRSSAAAAEPRA